MNKGNKDLVRETWKELLAGHLDAAVANMADDVTWTLPGSTPGFCGVKRGKKELVDFFSSGIFNIFPAGPQVEVTHMYDDGSVVTMEGTVHATTANGRVYENKFCFVIECAGGKIRHVREYVDTQRFAALLSP